MLKRVSVGYASDLGGTQGLHSRRHAVGASCLQHLPGYLPSSLSSLLPHTLVLLGSSRAWQVVGAE